MNFTRSLLLIFTMFASLTSCGQEQSTSWEFLKKYPKEDVLYFRDIAFGNTNRIVKWEGDIRIQIVGYCTENDSADLRSCIEELKQIFTDREVHLVDDAGDTFVRFTKNEGQFNPFVELGKPIPAGFTNTSLNFLGQLTRSSIFIRWNLEALNKRETLRHELCHAVGLLSHCQRPFKTPHLLGVTNYDFEQILDGNPEPFTKFPEADRNAIKILYEPLLLEGTSKKEFNMALKKLGY